MPHRGVNLPRFGRHEHRYLTHEQVEDLAQAAGFPDAPSKHAAYGTRANPMSRLVVLFLAYPGVRFGEMAALRVRCLDLRRNRASIVALVTPVAGLGLVWGTPKTHHRREVAIPRFLAAELVEHIVGRDPDDLVSPPSGPVSRCGSAPSAWPSGWPPPRSVCPT